MPVHPDLESEQFMKMISEMREGDRISGIYLCKQKTSALTRNGKPYENLILQDKSGTIDGKIWEPNSQGILTFDAMDFVDLTGDVTLFSGAVQLNIRRIRVARKEEYDPKDYVPITSRDFPLMRRELNGYVNSVANPYLLALLKSFFVEDPAFLSSFEEHSAAKTVHHSFYGGLMEHTLSVTRLCHYMANQYPVIKRDLLISAALLHDIGKTEELSQFPLNDYTEDGQLIGHIVIGAQMIHDRIRAISDFPPILEKELIHCILAHHGELEYGSPKKPALVEAVALNLADNTDARMQTLTELFGSDGGRREWLGFNKLFESNLRRTDEV